MSKEIEVFGEAEGLWDRAEKANKFYSRFNTFPYREGQRLIDDFYRFAQSIKGSETPQTRQEVYSIELKRRLVGEAVFLEHGLSGHYYTLEDVINLFGIDRSDIDNLQTWLLENKERTLEAIDRVYEKSEVETYRLPVPGDIPTFRDQAEAFAAVHIGSYHRHLGTMFADLTKAGAFLRDITPTPSTQERSYFDMTTKTLALAIPAVCYMTEDQTLHIDERELIRLYGHEGMGHGLNKVITDASELPNFLKKDSQTTRATIESVAQFYEQVIFDELLRSPKTQASLGIAHKFEEIYAEEKDTQLISEYQRRLFQYAIKVLADRESGTMNDPLMKKETIERKIAILSQVTLSPGDATSFIERFKDNFDSQGNLSFDLVRELIYSARPAERVIEVMRQKGVDYDEAGRNKIDFLLLGGFWTPIGLVQNAQVSESSSQE